LGNDTDDTAAPLERAVERGLQDGELVGTADEAREAACSRAVEPAAERADPGQLIDSHWRADALEIKGTQIAQLEVALDQACGVRGEIDAVRGGARLHALR